MDFKRLRERMVTEQLEARGISDLRVLEVMRQIPRHEFTPVEYVNNAYADYPLSIGEGQTISQPYIVALMTQALELKGEEKVLEIGTGSGYQTAILAALSREVYSVERVGVLGERARLKLDDLGFTNIKISIADGSLGWEGYSPYDRVIVTAA
ncbi:MAG: protein-L-isoaspartate O-methyltransferase family protein, partial [Candidatus Omnitrophota bacterium]